MVWYSHFLKDFSQFVVIHTVKGFGKEIEKNNRMGKTRDLFKKIRDIFLGNISCRRPNRSRR